MDELIIYLVEVKLFWWSSDIPSLIPISFDKTINRSDEQVMSDVKLSLIVQKRFQILLDNVGFELPIFMELFISH